jgi:insulysin
MNNGVLGCNYAYDAPVPNVNEENSAISFYCHVGDVADLRTRALNSLLSSMINEPFFNVMRTQEQLGYSVSCLPWASTSSLGLRFRVQSTRHPKFLEHRIENFIDTYRGTLQSMTTEEYNEHRNGVVEKKRKKLVNLGEERARYWGHIDNGYLDFLRGRCLRISNMARNLTSSD